MDQRRDCKPGKTGNHTEGAIMLDNNTTTQTTNMTVPTDTYNYFVAFLIRNGITFEPDKESIADLFGKSARLIDQLEDALTMIIANEPHGGVADYDKATLMQEWANCVKWAQDTRRTRWKAPNIVRAK